MRLLTAVGAAAGLFAASALIVLATTGDPAYGTATMSPTLKQVTAVEQSDFASRLPVIPRVPVLEIAQGTEVTVPAVQGLEKLSATLNGVDQKVAVVGDGFVVTIGEITGTGFADLVFTEHFADGSSATVPVTVRAGSIARAALVDATDSLGTPTSSIRLEWGDGSNAVGQVGGDESDIIVPAGIGLLEDGSVGILDTVNSRVISVVDGQKPLVVGDLPTPTFTYLVRSPSGQMVLAIDPINAIAVRVSTDDKLALPPIVSKLPLGMKFALDDDGALYLQSPVDGVFYSIATLDGARQEFVSTGLMERRLDFARAAVTGYDAVSIQPDLGTEPVEYGVGTSGQTSIMGMASGDGVVALLTAQMLGEVPTYRVVAATADGARTFEVNLDAYASVYDRLVVADGKLHVAYATAKAFVIDTYQLASK
jgi:hypothetical protein